MTEESSYLSFGGIYVHLRVAVPDGDVASRMLIVSSPLLNSFHWRKLIPELMDANCLTVTADMPGFGRSDCDRPTPQDDRTRAEILWGLVDAVDEATGAPGSTWHLCAHGTACPTILTMAELQPDSVRSQIHLSPLMALDPPASRGADDRLYDRRIRDREGFRGWIEQLSGYPMDDYILDRMRAPLIRPGARGALKRMLHEARVPREARLGFCPAMAIFGGRDPLLTDAARALSESCLEGAELHALRTAGHFPMETHSKALRDYFRGWLKYND